jgi:chromosome partitioning protein
MKKITFFNTKGGTGKTTVCFNYGWYLAEKHNKKILFLDFDPQVNLLQALTQNITTPTNKCLENLIVDYLSKKELNFDNYIININENMDILPTSYNISLLEEYLTDYLIEKAFYDKELNKSYERVSIINQILKDFIPTKYDYLIIDSQPNYSLLSNIALAFANNLIIVLKPEIFSFLDIKYLIRIINNLNEKFKININVIGLLINAYEKRKKSSKIIVTKLYEKYNSTFDIVPNKIRYLANYHESIFKEGKPIFLSYPHSEATEDLLKTFSYIDILIEKKIS